MHLDYEWPQSRTSRLTVKTMEILSRYRKYHARPLVISTNKFSLYLSEYSKLSTCKDKQHEQAEKNWATETDRDSRY